MPRSDRRPHSSTLVVLERGGQLPSRWGDTSAVQRIIVAQGGSETPAELLARTSARLSAADGRGPPIGLALLSCNASSAARWTRARAKLAELILAHVRRARGARLVLAAKRDAGAELRRELVALADRALTTMAGNGGSVSIWFDVES